MYDYDNIYRSFIAGNIEPLYRKLYPALIMYASRQLGDELSYLAEDCVQDAVMASYTERHNLKTSMAWYAYILKCIFHSSIRLVRKNRSFSNYLDDKGNDSLTPELDIAMLEQELFDMLYAAIESLPLRYREVLRMSYFEGLKNAEIARRMSVAEITVKKWKAVILTTLRKQLDDNNGKLPSDFINTYLTILLLLTVANGGGIHDIFQ